MALRRTALSKDGKTLKITVDWFGWHSLHLAVLSIVVILLFPSAFDHLSQVTADFLPNLLRFLVSGVVVALLYVTAANFLNRTEIVVDKQWIVVRHYPLAWPWRGQKVEVASLKEILVEVDCYTEDGPPFTIQALTHAGGKLELAAFYRREDADFAEEQIDKFLNVRDYRDYYVKRKANNI